MDRVCATQPMSSQMSYSEMFDLSMEDLHAIEVSQYMTPGGATGSLPETPGATQLSEEQLMDLIHQLAGQDVISANESGSEEGGGSGSEETESDKGGVGDELGECPRRLPLIRGIAK